MSGASSMRRGNGYGASPLPEYPRPQLVRDSFFSLNGIWRYAITKEEAPPATWEGDILVPFSPETRASGVSRIVQPDEFLWYEREFLLPAFFMKGRLILHFGAVDQCCIVTINGKEAGRHEGGYLPFSFDITSLLKKGRGGRSKQHIQVMVADDTESGPHAYGRQRLQHGGRQHMPQSGIWQTVWLESVPEQYITCLKITPLYDEEAVEIIIHCNQPLEGSLRIFARNTMVTSGSFSSGTPLRLSLSGFISWHPNNPFLYRLEISAGEDKLSSYLGMRKITVEPDPNGVARVFLNNKPFALAGVVDQGLFFEGLYTPPTDSAMEQDIRFAKECGFNTIRKHGKIEPLRWYHHCDRLGMLVWQDLPAGGEVVKSGFFTQLFSLGRNKRDNLYPLFGRSNGEGRQVYAQDMARTVALLYNTPSLGVWGLFQDGQGQFDAAALEKSIKALDGTRLVDHASGRYDQGAGDFTSIHQLNYKKDPPLPLNAKHRALVLTETGGFGFLPEELFMSDKPYAENICISREEYASKLAKLYQKVILPKLSHGLCGFILYQLSDAGDEITGLTSFNRGYRKIHPKGLARLNQIILEQME